MSTTHPDPAIAACIADVAAIEAEGIAWSTLARIGDTAGPSLYLLLYGRRFDRAVVFDPEIWHAFAYKVNAIAA